MQSKINKVINKKIQETKQTFCNSKLKTKENILKNIIGQSHGKLFNNMKSITKTAAYKNTLYKNTFWVEYPLTLDTKCSHYHCLGNNIIYYFKWTYNKSHISNALQLNSMKINKLTYRQNLK